jgi:hypothetical protein
MRAALIRNAVVPTKSSASVLIPVFVFSGKATPGSCAVRKTNNAGAGIPTAHSGGPLTHPTAPLKKSYNAQLPLLASGAPAALGRSFPWQDESRAR